MNLTDEPGARQRGRRNRGKQSPLRTIRLVLTGTALVIGFGMFPWVYLSFLAALAAPLPRILFVLVLVAGMILPLLLLGKASKRLAKAPHPQQWLLLLYPGAFFLLAPFILVLVRGSWEAEFMGVTCRTCSGPPAISTLGDYATPAMIYGAALVVTGIVGWLISLAREKRRGPR